MKVSVIGAGGGVGSSAAFQIAATALVEEVVLLGRRQNVIEQQAMDLSTAVSTLGVLVTAGTYSNLRGSDVVIDCAGVHQNVLVEDQEVFVGNVQLRREIMGEVRGHCPDAAVITVVNPADAMNYASWRAAGLDRRQFIGYSLNDSLRFREFVARVKGVKPAAVDATVIGEHGATQVPLFSSVRIDGRPTPFSEAEKEQIRGERSTFFRRSQALQVARTAGWTCAVGLTALTRAVVRDTREIMPGSAVLDGEYGLSGLSIGVPLRLGAGGIQEIVQWDLAEDEKAALVASAEKLAPAMLTVDRLLGGARLA